MVEQLLDDGGVRLFAAGQERRKLLDSLKLDHFARAGLVRAGSVDRPPFLILSVSTDSVEMLQGKSERIDHAMA